MQMFSMLLISIGILSEKSDFFVTGYPSSYDVRLINSLGTNSKEGRLEIYYAGVWGTVCNNGFTNASARVACATLGFGDVGTFIGTRYGAGADKVWLNEVKCVGTETGIHLCPHDGFGTHTSGGHSHSQDVSISCGCGDRYLSGPSGIISSPNYPISYYTNNLDCYSYVSLSSGHTVLIKFLAFNTQSVKDWVTITCASGKSFASSQYSGSQIPDALTISACSLVKVYFHTDNSSVYTGFSLTYNITSGCGDRYFSGLNGTISSPNYPGSYANDLDCYSFVSVSSGHTVLIKFLTFYTQSFYDWVTISCTSGNSFTSPRYSGSQIPAGFTLSACNLVKVYFHTDSRSTYTGFSLEYNITSGCGDRYFSGPNGTISSPNYPMAYANNLDCYSYVSVSSGHTVLISFLSFSTQSDNDWVAITCASGNSFISPQYSGSEIPDALTISTCSLVKVYLHTDRPNSTAYTGFSLEYNIISDEKTPLFIFILAALLGGAVLIIIILLVILLIRKSRGKQEVIAADVGDDCDGNEHELHNRRSEGNVYANDFGNAAEVADSESDDADNDYVNVAQVK